MKHSVPASNMRYEHMVFFKWNQTLTPENEQILINELLSFRYQIPGILDISAGRNMTKEKDKIQGYTIGLRIIFVNQQALKDYATHPVHQSFKEKIKRIYSNALVMDYPI
ncbi:TPA: Dabb family protein [Bacillus cereus]